ncbi:MAG: zinc-ribbon domain-containing protein [Acutalibacteraceae bacterium]
MLICPKCGTELNDGVVYCSKCGTNVTYQSQPSGGAQQNTAQQNTAQQNPFQNNASQQNYNGTTSDKFKAGVNNAVNKTKTFFFDTADETSMQDASDVQENKIFALISYLGYLFFIPMIVKPYSRYLRFHGNQGLTLCLYLIAVTIVNTVITSIIGIAGYSGMGALIAVTIINSIISFIFYGSFALLAGIGIYNAVKGRARELPLIGRIRILREY